MEIKIQSSRWNKTDDKLTDKNYYLNKSKLKGEHKIRL